MGRRRRDGELTEGARRRIVNAKPASTKRSYGGDWRRFEEWCDENDFSSLPTEPQTIANYVDHLANLDRSPATVERAICSIIYAHTAAGLDRPNMALAREAINQYRGERKTDVRRAEAILPEHLKLMVTVFEADTPMGIRNRAIIAFGFALGHRRAELAGLDLDDLKKKAHGYNVRIRNAKTDRQRKGQKSEIFYGKHPETCPVRTLNAWLAIRGSVPGPLFLRVDRHGNLGEAAAGRPTPGGRISGQAVARVVKRASRAANLDPEVVWSGHSLRRGFATTAYLGGASLLRIARQGGWQDGSKTLLGYIEDIDRETDNPLAGADI